MPSFVIPRAFPGLIIFVEQYKGVEITVTRLKTDDGEWFYGKTDFWADEELFHLSEVVGIQQSIDMTF